MRIIKPGRKEEIITEIEITCDRCEAVLMITQNDIEKFEWGRNIIPSYYVDCPECKNQITLYDPKLLFTIKGSI